MKKKKSCFLRVSLLIYLFCYFLDVPNGNCSFTRNNVEETANLSSKEKLYLCESILY